MNKSFWIFAGIIVAAFALISWNTIFKNGGGENSPAGDRVPCADPATPQALVMHIHPELTIIANGGQITIPDNVGLSNTCHRYIHTHEDLPLIHVESPVERDYTLGDFFWVWGEEFNRNQIMDYTANNYHKIVMTVDGKPNEEYENLILRDKQKIVVEYKKVAQ